MTAYYNEIDPFAASWLRQLISAGQIAPGDVDERSIVDVRPNDLRGYTQCHFFAGIGVWSYALRKAGWADDRPIWTMSCPCQPFSAAGKGGGFDDERHLWPFAHYLVDQCRPPVVAGEQVASKAVDIWIDLVQTDLEAVGYAFGAVPFPSAGVGAPHIRDRTFWVADAVSVQRERVSDIGPARLFGADVPQTKLRDRLSDICSVPDRLENALHSEWRSQHVDGQDGCDGPDNRREETYGVFGTRSEILGMADADDARLEGRIGTEERADQLVTGAGSAARGLGDAGDARLSQQRRDARIPFEKSGTLARKSIERANTSTFTTPTTGPTNGVWRNADWLFCRDGKWRPVEPGTFPLAHGATARVGRLRGYGNAINAEAAKAFIEAYLETKAETVDSFRLSDTVAAGAFE